MDTRQLLRLATLFYAAVLLGAWLWAFFFRQLGTLLGERPATGADLLQGVVLGSAIVAASHLARRLSAAVERAVDVLAAFFGPIRPVDGVYLALLSGFAEELLFRGALWPQLGLVGTTVLFGILHTVPLRTLLGYPVYAAVAGFAFGLLREASGSLWPPVVAHVTVNALGLVYVAGRNRQPSLPPLPPPAAKAAKAEHLPIRQDVDAGYPRTVWRYDLRVELTGTDRDTLQECLEHEDLALFRFVPREEVYRQLHEGRFVLVEALDEPFAAFPEDLATLSAYLFQTVQGIEVAERYADESTTDDVRAWKVVSQRGEWVKVPLLVPPPERGRFEVDPDREDVDVLEAHWSEYPRWFQDGMRFKYPRLRGL